MAHKVNEIVTMSDNALDNYGEQWRGVQLRITHKATKYMPAAEFYAKGKPEGSHPGYDEGAGGGGLYDLENVRTGEALGFSLYDWELN